MCNVSISIVTYNNEDIIEKCINSIISNINKHINYIIYVIDNNSNDNTSEVVKNLSGNIKLIENIKNIGFGAAHNQVLDLIDSDYHIVVNPDIEVANDIIFELCEYMNKNKEIGLLSPLIKFPNGEIQHLCKRNPTIFDLFIRLVMKNKFKERQAYFTMMETGYNKTFNIEYATGCFMFFRTEIFRKLNGFDDNIFLYLEDADITRRVNKISKTIFYPYNYVYHEWQRGAHKSIKLMLINFHSAWHYFKKWGTKFI